MSEDSLTKKRSRDEEEGNVDCEANPSKVSKADNDNGNVVEKQEDPGVPKDSAETNGANEAPAPQASQAAPAPQASQAAPAAVNTPAAAESQAVAPTEAAPATVVPNGAEGSESKDETPNPASENSAGAPSSNSATPAVAIPPGQPNPNPTMAQTASAPAQVAPVPAHAAPVPAGLPPPMASSAPVPVDPSAQATVTNPASIVEERGEVSALYVGRVIGKGGEMIRDLQARSGCRIDVDQSVPPGQPRVITYRGTRKTVDFAKQLVNMLCTENVSEADLPLGEAKREVLVVPAASVGKIIGRGGEMIRELQSRSHAKIQVDHNGTGGLSPTQKRLTITGTDQSVTKAKEMVHFLVANPLMDAMQALNMLVEDKLNRGGVWGSGPPYPNMPNQGQNMQPHSGGYGYDQPAGYAAQAYQQPHAYAQYGAGGTESDIFYATKNFMGRIIGQKGVTINDLQRRSGCDIQINQDVPPGQDCEISIRGARSGIEMVKQMLREIIEIGPNHPYAGGAQHRAGYGHGGSDYSNPNDPYGQYAQQQQHGYNAYPYQQPADPYGQAYAQHAPHQQAGPYGQPAAAPNPYGQPAMYGQTSGGYPMQQQQQQQQPYQGYAAPQPQQPMQHSAPVAAVPPPATASSWKSASAPDGQVYYYNEKTGETQWEKPVGMP